MVMKRVIQIIGGSIALLLLCFAPRGVVASDQKLGSVEFVGSTLGDALPREFLGGLATNAPCHCITWHITLSANDKAAVSGMYNLTALYQVPTRSNTNRSEPGPKVAAKGTWEILKGTTSRPEVVIYRFTSEKSQRSLSFLKVSEDLLHLLNSDGSLMVGNGGWSYTLNRADRAEKPVDPSLAESAPDMSYKISPLATGPTVFGVFEGRSPCHGIARELKLPQHAGCTKVKWRVTLYKNPETSAPTTYKVEGTLHRQNPREGTWSIVHGTKADPKATVYQLNPAQTEAALLLLKADDNVLLFLNQDREPLVGNADFSYTLNRVAAKRVFSQER
jgi:hypothetical protein